MKFILTAGFSFLSFFAFSQDGVEDLTFFNLGVSSTPLVSGVSLEAQAAVQNDGKILHMFSSKPGGTGPYICAVIRHKANGGIDSSFGTNGRYSSNSATMADGRDMILQQDGKILVCGRIDSGLANHPCVMRIKNNGTLDSSYGINGRTIVPFYNTGGSLAIGMTLQADGKLVVCGNVGASQATERLGLFRLTTSGMPDSSFDGDGKLTSDLIYIPPIDRIGGIGIQNDGRIIVAGRTPAGPQYQVVVLRFNSNGSLDNSFGNGGKFQASHPKGCWAGDLAIQPDGKIVVASTTATIPTDFALWRLTQNGVLDTSFGTGGVVTTDYSAFSQDFAYSVAVQTDGRILVAGDVIFAAGNASSVVLRYLSNGILDNTFGTGGRAPLNAYQWSSISGMLGSQGNKLILGVMLIDPQIGGYSFAYPAVVRFNNSAAIYNSVCLVSTPVVTIAGNVLSSTSTTGNQWYLNGNPINGANGQSVTATSAGQYTVVTTQNGCMSMPSNTVAYSVTAIDPLESEWKLQVGPNPVQNQLVIHHNSREKLDLEILDLAGRRVWHKTGIASTSFVDMSKLNGGVYVVKIVDRKTKKEIRKMVVKG
jgi:uncharacterized delta-60 repeat protein